MVGNYKGFLKDAFWVYYIKVFQLFIKWSMAYVAYKLLPDSEKSQVFLIMSIYEIGRVLADFGIDGVIYSRLKKGDGSFISTYSAIKFFISMPVAIAAILLAYSHIKQPSIFYLILIDIPFASLASSSLIQCQKNNDYHKINRLALANAFAMLVGMMLSLYDKSLLINFIASLPLLFSAISLVVFCNYIDNILLKLRKLKFKNIQKIFKISINYGLISLLVILYSRLDYLLVLPLMGLISQTEYGFANRMIEPIFLILTMAVTSLIVNISSNNIWRIREYKDKWIGVNLKTTILISILFAGVTYIILSIVFYQILYVELDKVLMLILVSSIPIRVANVINSFFLTRFLLSGYILKAAILNMFFTFSFGLVLYKFYGLHGIAFSVLMAESINYFYQKFVLRKIN